MEACLQMQPAQEVQRRYSVTLNPAHFNLSVSDRSCPSKPVFVPVPESSTSPWGVLVNPARCALTDRRPHRAKQTKRPCHQSRCAICSSWAVNGNGFGLRLAAESNRGHQRGENSLRKIVACPGIAASCRAINKYITEQGAGTGRGRNNQHRERSPWPG